MTDELHYKILKVLQQQPDVTQRQLAGQLGISLGKANYCVRALVDKGWLKIHNFKNNENKLAYAYLLTPKGVTEKARITFRFLQRKVAEYEEIEREIEELRREVAQPPMPGPED